MNKWKRFKSALNALLGLGPAGGNQGVEFRQVAEHQRAGCLVDNTVAFQVGDLAREHFAACTNPRGQILLGRRG